MTTTTIELLRHGEPEGGDCMRGSIDVALTTNGWQQMNNVLDLAAGFDQIISSTLSRCADFATTLSQETATPLCLNEQWREIDFGDWDGVPYKTLWQQHPTEISQYWQNPWQHTPPQGESLIDFDHRIAQAWQQLLQDYSGQHILVVTHGGVIRQLIHQILNMPQDNTHLSRIDIPYAAKIKISVFVDKDNKQWPRLHWPV